MSYTQKSSIMILHGNRCVTLAEAMKLVRARYGAAPGEPVFSSERP